MGTAWTRPPMSEREASGEWARLLPIQGGKLCFLVASFPGCSRGPADETPTGSSSLLGVSSSAGCLGVCISYGSIHFFLSWLATRRMFLSPPATYITIKLPSKEQWWQEMTNVTSPPVRYELPCIPFPEKNILPFP